MFLFTFLMFPKSCVLWLLFRWKSFNSLGQRVFLFDGTNVHQLILGETCVYAEDSDINPPWEILTGGHVWQLAPVHFIAPGCKGLNLRAFEKSYPFINPLFPHFSFWNDVPFPSDFSFSWSGIMSWKNNFCVLAKTMIRWYIDIAKVLISDHFFRFLNALCFYNPSVLLICLTKKRKKGLFSAQMQHFFVQSKDS